MISMIQIRNAQSSQHVDECEFQKSDTLPFILLQAFKTMITVAFTSCFIKALSSMNINIRIRVIRIEIDILI